MNEVFIEIMKMVGGVVIAQVGRVVCDRVMEKIEEKKDKKKNLLRKINRQNTQG